MMLAYSASELWSITVMQSFAGLSLFSVLLLMALGLAIIFGQMGVVNLAHGEFMALGAYTVYLCSAIVQNHAPSLAPYYFIIAIGVAFCAAALTGLLVEWSLIRFLYKRPLDTLLATWGLSLVMQQAFRSIFGAREVTPTLPEWLMGSFKPNESIDIPINGVFVMGLTLLLTFGVWLFMYRSRMGLHMRATVQNRAMSGAVGINTKLVDRFTFCLGCGIAGVAGAAFTIHCGHVSCRGVRRHGQPVGHHHLGLRHRPGPVDHRIFPRRHHGQSRDSAGDRDRPHDSSQGIVPQQGQGGLNHTFLFQL
jgi:urea transport system permease protein